MNGVFLHLSNEKITHAATLKKTKLKHVNSLNHTFQKLNFCDAAILFRIGQGVCAGLVCKELGSERQLRRPQLRQHREAGFVSALFKSRQRKGHSDEHP